MPLFLSGLMTILTKLTPLASLATGLPGVLSVIAANILAHWKAYLIAFLAATTLGCSYEWNHTHERLKSEKAAHAADIKSYKDAQAAAEVQAKVEQAALTKTAKDKANAADKNYSSIITQYRANLVRYQAAQGRSRRSHRSQLSNTAQNSNGPSTGAVVSSGPDVTISSDDAGICAENTARLQSAHDWALQLKEPINGTNSDPETK